MSTQRAIQLLLQALVELHGEGQFTETAAVAKPEGIKQGKRSDRSGHQSRILGRNAAALRDAMIAIQVNDAETSHAERTYEEMHEALLKNGHRELFVYADKKRQLDQIERTKSLYSKRFGSIKDYPGRLHVLRPLPKRNVVKMQPGDAAS